MRGKDPAYVRGTRPHRITPAYAGKSFLSTSRAFCNQDHPRLCGEKLATFAHSSKVTGSPPPMRGKGFGWLIDHKDEGITPAYAGKRSQMAAVLCISWDHPRLCGEKGFSRMTIRSILGSPPPMRGKAK